jgi:hypothetical protein
MRYGRECHNKFYLTVNLFYTIIVISGEVKLGLQENLYQHKLWIKQKLT